MSRLRESLHRIFGPIFHPGAPRENTVVAPGPTSEPDMSDIDPLIDAARANMAALAGRQASARAAGERWRHGWVEAGIAARAEADADQRTAHWTRPLIGGAR